MSETMTAFQCWQNFGRGRHWGALTALGTRQWLGANWREVLSATSVNDSGSPEREDAAVGVVDPETGGPAAAVVRPPNEKLCVGVAGRRGLGVLGLETPECRGLSPSAAAGRCGAGEAFCEVGSCCSLIMPADTRSHTRAWVCVGCVRVCG